MRDRELHEICRMPDAERIVGLVQFRDDVIIATETKVYKLIYDGTDYALNLITDRVRPGDA